MYKNIIFPILIVMAACGDSTGYNTDQCEKQPGDILTTWTALLTEGANFRPLEQFCAKEGTISLEANSAVWLTKTLSKVGQTNFEVSFSTICSSGELWIGHDPNTRVSSKIASTTLSQLVNISGEVTYYIVAISQLEPCFDILIKNVNIEYVRK